MRAGAIFVAAIATAVAIGAGLYLPGQGPDSFAFYVAPASQNGGDSNPGTKAAPFLTLNKAYTAASPGQTVQVACGTYAYSDNIAVDATKTSPNDVVFSPATSAPDCWTMDGRLTIRGKHLTINGLHQVINDGNYDLNATIIGADTCPCVADDVTINNSSATRFFINNSSNITINGGDYGRCVADYGNGGAGTVGGNQGVCNNRIDGGTDILIEFTSMHDDVQTWDGVSGPGNGQPPHSECLAVFAGLRVNIWYDKMWNCGDSASLLVQAAGADKATNISLRGNWINTNFDGTSANPTDQSTWNNKCSVIDIRSQDLDGTFDMSWNALANCAGALINFMGTSNAPSITSATVNANIGHNSYNGTGGCPSGSTTADWNAYIPFGSTQGQTACGTNQKKLSSTPSTPLPYVNTSTHGDMDFHLKPTDANYALVNNLVPSSVTGGIPPLDIDGQTRSAPTDIGSDQD